MSLKRDMMRRNLLILSLLLVISSSLSAQYRDFVCGFKGGIALHWLRPDNAKLVRMGAGLGYDYGFNGEYYFNENYAVAFGFDMLYLSSRYGFIDVRPVPSVEREVMVTRQYHGSYLELPLSMKLKTDKVGRFRFFGRMGVGIGFRLKAKVMDSYSYNNYVYEADDYVDVKDQYSLVRGSFLIGGGSEFVLKGSTCLYAELLFNGGINNAFSTDFATRTSINACYNLLGLQVGIMF